MRKKSSKPRRAVLRLRDLDHSKATVLNSLGSPASRRAYEFAIDEFIAWYCSEPRLAFGRIVVTRFRMSLEARGLASSSINQRLAAVRRLAYEAADCGLLSPDLAAGIRRVKGAKQLGHRSGNWLTLEQCSTVLNGTKGNDLRAKRDHAMIAVLIGCGLRRAELAALQMDQVQTRQGHWAIVDLVGKGGHIRTVPMPRWVKDALDSWTSTAGIQAAEYSGQLAGPAQYGAQASAKMWSGTWSARDATKATLNTSHHTICAGPALDCATAPEVSWSRSSFCWAIPRCRRPSVTWVASRTLGTR